MDAKRYQIFWVNLDPTVGREIKKTRPAVIVSPDAMNKWSDMVIVCPITSSLHPTWRTRVQITCDGKPAEIAVDQIRAVSKERLTKKIGVLTKEAVEELRQVIQDLLVGE